jgi:hypothetical protein
MDHLSGFESVYYILIVESKLYQQWLFIVDKL